MSQLKRVGVAEVKRNFADILGAVKYKGDRYIIERNGTPMAALVPLEESPEPPSEQTGFLSLVGAFADAPEYSEVLDQIVRERIDDMPRPVTVFDGWPESDG